MPCAKKANDMMNMTIKEVLSIPTERTGRVKTAAIPMAIFLAWLVLPVFFCIWSDSQPPIIFAIPKAKNGIHKILPI